MPAPATVDEFLDLVRKSGVVDDKRLEPPLAKLRAAGTLPREPGKLAGILVRDGVLTQFQAEQIMAGKWRRFTIGKYKVLERLGSGGMGSVYLCEHKLMRRRVAVKVLPTAKAKDQSSLERFYREARAVAALDHPNIVHAYDIDQDDELHFLVMEFVDGASLQEIVRRGGRLDPVRAAHYMYQASLGLDHAQTKGIVHRDIKPGNLLVDRAGTLKILDMGLARFFNDEEDDLTRKFEENVLGTADYLAPEQAVDSHEADTRADIYSLGATFYFTLTGRTPFGDGSVAQKLIWHQTRKPEPIQSLRPDIPDGLAAILDKMMAKAPKDRFQTPAELSQALYSWVQEPIALPSEKEMPRLSLAAVGAAPGEATQTGSNFRTPAASPSSKKNWQISPPAPTAVRTPGPQPAPTARNPAAAPPVPAARNPAPTTPRPIVPPPPAAIPVLPSTPSPRDAAQPTVEFSNGLPPLPEKQKADSRNPFLDGWNSPPTEAEAEEAFAPVPTIRANRFASHLTLWIALGVVGLIVSAVVVTLAAFFWRQEPAPVKLPLKVSRTESGEGIFRTIQGALDAAKTGDVIELWDERYEENVRIDPAKSRTSLTLKAAPGKQIVWTFARGKADDALVRLTNAQNFKLVGDRIQFDGQDQCNRLFVISYNCAGLVIKNIQVKGFKESALFFHSCDGKGQPVVIQGLKVVGPTSDSKTVIWFEANPQSVFPFNDFIQIKDSHFGEMPLGQAIQREDNTVTGSNLILPPGHQWVDPLPQLPRKNQPKAPTKTK
jgi:serine/threonine protein kinase